MTPIRYITVLTAASILCMIPPAVAQNARIVVRISAESESVEALREVPIMISIVRDGAIVHQSEQTINNGLSFDVPAGVYDVRLEADGAVTEVKRGITANEGQRVALIGGPMQAGEGLHIVEYATGGLTREEIAVRLTHLEEGMSNVQRVLEELVQAHKQPQR